jgi:hypothetical protein
MAKLVLLSCVIGMIAIPIMAARQKDARRGFQRLVLMIIAFNLFYLFAMRFIYPRLL